MLRKNKTWVSGMMAVTLVMSMMFVSVTTASGAELTPEEMGQRGLRLGKPFAGETITVLLHDSGQMRTIKKLTESEFEPMTGIKVNLEIVPYPTLFAKQMVEFVGKTGRLDVVNSDTGWVPTTYLYAINLDSLIERDVKGIEGYEVETIPANVMEYHQVEGKQYAFPIRPAITVMYYRKDVYEDLGLTFPDTWSEFVDVSKKIQQATDLDSIALFYGMRGSGDASSLIPWYVMLLQKGNHMFDKKWNPIFNNDVGVEVTQFYMDLMLKEKVAPPRSKVYHKYEAFIDFQQGKTAHHIDASWPSPEFEDPTKSKIVGKVSVAEMPTWAGRPKITRFAGHGLLIPKDSKHKEAAWEWIKWVTSEPVEIKTLLMGGDTNPVRTGAMSDPEVSGMYSPFYKVLRTVLEGEYYTWPLLPEWSQFIDILNNRITAMAAGAAVKPTLDEAAAEVRKILTKAGYYK